MGWIFEPHAPGTACRVLVGLASWRCWPGAPLGGGASPRLRRRLGRRPYRPRRRPRHPRSPSRPADQRPRLRVVQPRVDAGKARRLCPGQGWLVARGRDVPRRFLRRYERARPQGGGPRLRRLRSGVWAQAHVRTPPADIGRGPPAIQSQAACAVEFARCTRTSTAATRPRWSAFFTCRAPTAAALGAFARREPTAGCLGGPAARPHRCPGHLGGRLGAAGRTYMGWDELPLSRPQGHAPPSPHGPTSPSTRTSRS